MINRYTLINTSHLLNVFNNDSEKVIPIYEELPGWNCSTLGITNYEELPFEMIEYINKISHLVGAPVSIISTGPKREETICITSEKLF